MKLDLLSYSLDELYMMQADYEREIQKHRQKEPSTKRKHFREHEIWVLVSDSLIETLHEIRDAIIAKKSAATVEQTEE